MESEDLKLDVSYDLTTKKYFINQETLNEIIHNYVKLSKVMQIIKSHKPKIKKLVYHEVIHKWVDTDSELRQELEKILRGE
jgi:hypothetical protein